MNVMIDIETYGTDPYSAIASIGAVSFEVSKEFKPLSKFYVNIDQKSNKEINRVYNKDTIDWWKRQDPEVVKKLLPNQKQIKDALTDFFSWFPRKSLVWSQGSDFDIPIIKSSANVLGMILPWEYYDVRCARTFTKIFNVNVKDFRSKGHHDAMTDALEQAEVVNHLLYEISQS